MKTNEVAKRLYDIEKELSSFSNGLELIKAERETAVSLIDEAKSLQSKSDALLAKAEELLQMCEKAEPMLASKIEAIGSEMHATDLLKALGHKQH